MKLIIIPIQLMETKMATDHEPRDKSKTEPTTCAALVQQSTTDLPDIGNNPNQPRQFQFRKQSFGRKNVMYCSFQPAWFD